MRGLSIAAIICNLFIILNMAFFTVFFFKKDGEWALKNIKRSLKYFTFLSNEFIAIACLLTIIFPQSFTVGIIKYVAMVSVSVTMITVIVFLGPTIGYKVVLTGYELWMHLINPLVAIGIYFGLEKHSLPFPFALLGAAPVVLYGAFYLYKVILVKEEKRWEDFYGFNKGGKWYLSIFIMITSTLLLCVGYYWLKVLIDR